jgi:hypothetical protein
MRSIERQGCGQGQRPRAIRDALLIVALMLAPIAAKAEDPIGQIKTETGAVTILHAGKPRAAAPGDHVYASDTIITAAHASVGVTFADNSLLALGPSSRLGLDQFRFNATTHEGSFDVSLRRGTLAVKSGQIVKQTPGAMRVRTPAALLGVRGTEFAVRADGGRS